MLMKNPLDTFESLTIQPGVSTKIEIPKGTILSISQISLYPLPEMPNSGRVVLYVSFQTEKGQSEKIAIAPLTINICESLSVDFKFNSSSPIIFSTSGSPIPVSLSGHKDSLEQLNIQDLK